MTQSRVRDVRITICGIHNTEFQGTSCPECLAKMKADYQALKKIPYRAKARRAGALYPAKRFRRVSS